MIPKVTITLVHGKNDSSSTSLLTSLLTESYSHNEESVQEQSGCILTKTFINESNPRNSPDKTIAVDSSSSQMSVDFWQVDSSKEDIWSKLKVIEIFEITNILMMVYDCRDRV